MARVHRMLSVIAVSWWLSGVGVTTAVAADHPTATAAPTEQTETLTAVGELMYVGKRTISVQVTTTSDSSTDLLLPLAEHLVVEHAKGLSELRHGDRVSIEYERTTMTGEDGQPVLLKTVAKKIALLRTAAK